MSNIYSNSATPIYLNKTKVLKLIVLLRTTSSFLKSFPLSSSRSTKLLYTARAISVCFTTNLPQWISFLIAPITPKLIFKNSALNIAIIRNTPIWKPQPVPYGRSIRSTINTQMIVPLTILRIYLYQIRNSCGFSRNLIKIRTRRPGSTVILKIQLIAVLKA